jgi:bacterioferritin
MAFDSGPDMAGKTPYREPPVLDDAGNSSYRESPVLLDDASVEVAGLDVGQGAATPHFEPWRENIIQALNDSLATELVCVLRYKRHYFTAGDLAAAKIAEEFLGYANEESGHADRLAQRIVQLGGQPDFSPDSLSRRSRVAYDDSPDLAGMVRANLTAESAVIESYLEIISLIGDADSTTRQLIEDILIDEEEHAEELKEWLADRVTSRSVAG